VWLEIGAARIVRAASSLNSRRNIMSMQRIEISEDVLMAIRAVVEYWRSTDPDHEDIIINDLPVLYAWLEGLGLLSPPDTEEPA
jgi:hypothetical protein